jgi:hypothetical protein
VSAQNIKPTPGIQGVKNKAFILKKKNKGIDMIIEVEKFFSSVLALCFIFSFIFFCFSSSFVFII